MSHFSVAVISHSIDDIDDLLGPFCEDADHPSVATEFVDVEYEYRESYATESIERIKAPDGEYLSPRDKRFRTIVTSGGTFVSPEPLLPPDYTRVDVPYKELYPSFEEYMMESIGMVKDEETGRYGYYTNPNAKWDWFVIGGRWRGMVKLKPGKLGNLGLDGYDDGTAIKEGYCDQAMISDVDFSINAEAYQTAIRFWEIHVEGQEPQAGEEELLKGFHWGPEYYTNQYASKEQYAQEQASFHTWAILTPDGEWYEAGDMGWFGMHNATMESREEYQADMQALLNDWKECYITIVDCHI